MCCTIYVQSIACKLQDSAFDRLRPGTQGCRFKDSKNQYKAFIPCAVCLVSCAVFQSSIVNQKGGVYMNVDDIQTVAVIGAGDMGHGIAEVALIADYKVFLRDISREFVDRGTARIHESLDKLVSKGKVAAGHHEKIREQLLVPCVDIREAVREADLVVEAVPEDMDLKKKTFKEMDAAAPAHTILASNTSTMSISEIALVTQRPQKVLGLHYFNPAVLMRLVEVIRGDRTSDETLQIGYDFVQKNGKVPVRVQKDIPGFIVNRVQAPSGVLLNCILEMGKMFSPLIKSETGHFRTKLTK